MSRWEWVYAAFLYVGALTILAGAAHLFTWLGHGSLALNVAGLALSGSVLVMLRQIIYEDRRKR